MPQMRLERRPLRLSLAVLLGAASVATFEPIGWFPLIWLTIAGLYALLLICPDKTWHEGALTGGAFGLGFFLTGTSWVYVSLNVFGNMAAPLAAMATFLFCSLLATLPALCGALFSRLHPAADWQRALLFTALWTLTEWLRGWLFTGFPWLAIGYSQAPPSPLAGFAPILGVYGVSFVTVLSAVLLYAVIRRWISVTPCPASQWIRWCPALPLLGIGALLGMGSVLSDIRWTQALDEPLRVALLQGNVPQDLKWRPEKFAESLRIYYRLALDHPAQLTVLPETALPAFLEHVPREYLSELEKLAKRENGDLLFGIATGDAGRYANSAVSIGAGREQRYHKTHLVPFGEFIPPGFGWFLKLAQIPMSDFTPGERNQPPLQIGTQRIAVNICYEDAFGEEIIRALPDATLLVNLSNVAWFGDSLAPAQHLQMARLRALETGRPMLRATNTGMTAIINPDGSLHSALPPFTRGALTGEVHGYAGTTPYVRWGNTLIVSLALIISAVLIRRKRPTASPT